MTKKVMQNEVLHARGCKVIRREVTHVKKQRGGSNAKCDARVSAQVDQKSRRWCWRKAEEQIGGAQKHRSQTLTPTGDWMLINISTLNGMNT